ncbi:toxin-antitoxin system TumE family protein [Spirosoma pollinicola]|uniref:Uncharacterized protein n=1 Tax=Spirosoma pollinicola TaxID=2057025 RepID=A0A2K8YWK1_9BACT|nr:DUF6516 family protein [Spirosoma pollinicola]AUD02007.1 hypothetical protein CWM47_09390 [Spirosoma pollinicola]
MSSNYAGIQHILDDLDKNSFISQYDVLKYEHTTVKFQLRLQIKFIDQSVLFTNEYIGSTIRKYAFHWQQFDNQSIIRWDNAPHFPKLSSFPHHKHDYRQALEIVTDSVDISLVEVLTYIHNQLTNL